jgi:hypothetical protein
MFIRKLSVFQVHIVETENKGTAKAHGQNEY